MHLNHYIELALNSQTGRAVCSLQWAAGSKRLKEKGKYRFQMSDIRKGLKTRTVGSVQRAVKG